MKPQRLERRRYDAAETKSRILEQARLAFADRGFDHVGLREVAAAAQVDPALVIRYFGSKESLFLAALESDFDLMAAWSDDPARVGESLADRILLAKHEAACHDPLLLVLRSSPNAKAAKLIKAKIETDLVHPIASRLSGPDAITRASLIVGVLVGLAFVKDVIRSDGIATITLDEQRRHYASLIQRCVDGPDRP